MNHLRPISWDWLNIEQAGANLCVRALEVARIQFTIVVKCKSWTDLQMQPDLTSKSRERNLPSATCQHARPTKDLK